MKITRYKKAQKILTFYQNNFQFHEPYQIIVDGTFSLLALRMKINIKDQLPKYLGAECDILTTGCCINEAEKLGPELHGAVVILRQFTRMTCGHAEKPLPAIECLKKLSRGGNPEKYLIATQDQELQELLRKKPAVPILYLHHQSLTLDKPSEKSLEAAHTQQSQKLEPTDYQKEVLAGLKKKEFGLSPGLPKKRKRRGPKMPNPLSCKKAKTSTNKKPVNVPVPESGDNEKKHGKRRHKRLKMSDALKSIHDKLVAETAVAHES